MPAFQEESHAADGFLIFLIGGETLDAGAQAAVDVEFQAGVRVVAGEIHVAGGDLEVTMDEVDQAVREVSGKVGAEVGGSVFAEAAGDVDSGVFLSGELDVGVSFVVAEKDVEARLPLLDEVVF
jgi:hypothetical protein